MKNNKLMESQPAQMLNSTINSYCEGMITQEDALASIITFWMQMKKSVLDEEEAN